MLPQTEKPGAEQHSKKPQKDVILRLFGKVFWRHYCCLDLYIARRERISILCTEWGNRKNSCCKSLIQQNSLLKSNPNSLATCLFLTWRFRIL